MTRRKILLAVFLLFFNHSFVQAEDADKILGYFRSHNIEVVTLGSTSPETILEELNKISSDNLKMKLNPQDIEPEQRLKQFKEAWNNPKNDIIWALRGGAGTSNVVELLWGDKKFRENAKQSPKIFIGYCDVTSMHLFLSQELGLQTIHAPVFQEIVALHKKSPISFYLVKRIVEGVKKITLVGLKPRNAQAFNSTYVSGKMTGGNLSILQTSIGTKWQIDTKDKIVFIEDCYEKPYRIIRMLEHLKSGGILKGARALVIGDLCDTSPNMQSLITGFSEKLAIPVYSIDAFGHGIYNFPMIYNAQGTIVSDGKAVKLTQHLN